MDIRIIVNKDDKVVPQGTTVNKLLSLLDYNNRVAVWINGKQLLFADYPNLILHEGDQIKILRLVGGG
jgi:sulfur carrier protein